MTGRRLPRGQAASGSASRSLLLVGLLAAGPGLLVASGHGPAPENDASRIRALLDGGRFTEGRRLADEHLERAKRAHGAESLPAVEALDLLVEARLRDGDRTLALADLAERALPMKERLLGPDDVRLGPSLRNLAWAQLGIRAIPSAGRETLERALALYEEHRGADHPDTLDTMVELGRTLRAAGKFEDSLRLLRRAAAALEGASSSRERLVRSRALQQLAMVLLFLGDVERARPHAEDAVRIQEEVLGIHPELALTINRLAVLAWNEGNYVEARALFDRQEKIQRQTLRPDHPNFGTTWVNTGGLLHDTGDLQGAKEFFDRSRALPAHRESPDVPGRSQTDYAKLAIEMGDYDYARNLLRTIVDAAERKLPPDHPTLVQLHRNLGTLYRDTGEIELARRHLEVALDLCAMIFKTAHPHYAEVLHDLALLEERAGDRETARRHLERAVEIFGAALGEDHPLRALALGDLSRLRWYGRDTASAVDGSLRAASGLREHLARISRHFAEREALSAEADRLRAVQVAMSFLLSGDAAARGQAVPRVWDEIVRSRALVLDEIAARHRVALAAEGGDVAALRHELQAARARLARLAFRGPADGKPAEYARRLREAEREKENAERALARVSASFRRELTGRSVGLAHVRDALPAGSALVAFQEFQHLVRRPKSAAASAPPPPAVRSYLALILRAGDATPSVVPLGAAEDLERLILRWRTEVGRRPETQEDVRRYREAGRDLRRALWEPIATHVGSPRRVFLVPDGAIHLVAFAALPDSGGGYLVEGEAQFHYLSAERDLVLWNADAQRGRGFLVLGGADYDARPGEQPGAVLARNDAGAGASAATFRGLRSACGDFRSLRFDPLPGSLAEAREIEELVARHGPEDAPPEPVTLLTGAAAGEAVLKRLAPGHRVMHLATHGFLVGGACESAFPRPGAERPGAGGAHELRTTVENPLLLTGIAVATANHRDEAGGDEEDGILTAEEAASLDLRGVEWAVLSGCETGLGSVQTGEGVLGLRRAFQVAGARTLILSLWSVEDHSAREWFRHLYGARFEGASTPEAIRRASLEILQQRRQTGVTTHPFFWGAFVAAGDWR